MTATEQFIHDNARADVRQLALRRPPADVDLRWALQQIEGRQLAERKLPRWAATEGLWFPQRLSLEQCSSEATAHYKHDLAARLLTYEPSTLNSKPKTFIDLTAGLGADFAALATLFGKATYVERNAELCRLALHNFPLLGLDNVSVRESTAEEMLAEDWQADLIMIDPARRDSGGRKTVLIEDCTPDICALQTALRRHARFVLIKLSPMLDIKAALRALDDIAEVHVVGADGECKELLFVMRGESAAALQQQSPNIEEIPIYCSDGAQSFCFTLADEAKAPLMLATELQTFIYEPSATAMKAAPFRTLCQLFPGLRKLAPDTHLYTSATLFTDFPGRTWRIADSASFAKADLRRLLAGLSAAELSVRGFPMNVAALRRQLRLREGGTAHFLATTLADGSRRLLRVEAP
ncbi:MAG: hypothetical protein IJJ94_02480 [Bacteroidaceae bacterium]|nr:hypothetical protein [Bacteroidaceae bacterium]